MAAVFSSKDLVLRAVTVLFQLDWSDPWLLCLLSKDLVLRTVLCYFSWIGVTRGCCLLL